MNVRFCPLVSGSSGNSTYISNGQTHILIDAGVSCKQIVEHINQINQKPEELNAIFVSHEHVDHIKGVKILSKKYNIPVYATEGTWHGIKGLFPDFPPENIRYVYPNEMTVVNDICIKPFSTPHDANDPVMYSVFYDKFKMTVATDIGYATNVVKENIYDSDVLLIEANHDEAMLKKGSYPWYLKKRILGDQGHLSNICTGQALSEIMTGRLKYVFLGHLSSENNEPHLAYETVENILNENRIKVGTYLKLDTASRCINSRIIEL